MAKARSKNWWESRTMWVAIAQAVLGILAVVVTEYPEAGWALVVKSVLDALLRMDTAKPVR